MVYGGMSILENKSGGFTCWLTGLSGAGKSTLAIEIRKSLHSLSVPCEILDGDVIRNNLSRDLGFSHEDRKHNILRVAFVCSLLNKYGINTIVALISPFAVTRHQCRLNLNNFIEIYVDCPLEVCIERDPKGLYKKALAGDIPEFTGISSPYEAPQNPDLIVKTHEEDIKQSVDKVLRYLDEKKFLKLF